MVYSIKFIPIDYDYFDFHGKTYARVFGRTDKNKRACVIDSCDIYFWAILNKNISDKKIKDIQKKIENIQIEKEIRVTKVLKTEVHEKNFLGNPVKAIKIFISNTKDAKKVAEKINFPEIDKIREYDINFLTKYILERGLKPLVWYDIEGEILNHSEEFGGLDLSLNVDVCLKLEKISESKEQPQFKPKVLAYDIETEEFDIGKGKILMISLVGENFKKVLTWTKKSKKNYVESFKDEAEMIENFVKNIKNYSPDILVGYFSDGFDLPYIKSRAENNKVKLEIGLDDSPPSFSHGKILTGKIKGIVHIDLFRFIRTAYSQYLQSETLSLNEVASEFLGEKKLDFEFKHSSKIDHEGWENYFEYNLHDSVLTYKLFEKIWPDLLEFCRIIQEPLFEISRDGMSTLVENYVIHHISKFNEIIEKKPFYNEINERIEREKYKGAFVLQPKAGMYENLAFFDFTSMYGSVIVSYNLSKSSFSEKKIPNSYEVKLENKKVYFSKKPAFFPELLKEIIEKRKEYKKEFSKNPNPFTKARSNTFKLLANASYGYQGFFGARYYCLEAAAATAALARKHIKETIDFVNKKNFNVIYGDTDSICLQLGNHSKEDALKLLNEINENLPGIMELDLEDFYKRGIWVTKRTGEFGAKKKYALINEEGKIKIRGFETVRRDWCNLAREIQNKILESILREGNEKKALEFLKTVIKKLKNREIDLSMLIIRTQLKKSIHEYKAESPHVTIAKKMLEKGMPVDIGMLIEYYISESDSGKKNKNSKTKILVRERAKLPDEPGEYDIEYYLNNQIFPAVENIFEIFNVNIKELFQNTKQTNLDNFSIKKK